jgi:hypothetical protein
MEEYKIYRIVCNETDEIYFGKTIRTLEHRLSEHKDLSCSSKQIIERDNYYIEQIDSTFDKEESVKKERYYIETFECVNKYVPGRTVKEYLEENKEYIITRRKKYYEKNKDEIIKLKLKYYEKNKDKILEKHKEKYTCKCGSTLTKHSKARHERESKKHINFINSK